MMSQSGPLLPVSLTSEEQKLLERLRSHFEEEDTPEQRRAMLVTEAALAKLLLDRNAIPQIRLDYFCEPEFQTDGSGRSHKERFEKASSANDPAAPGTFLRFLLYFINGPNLPEKMIASFYERLDGATNASRSLAYELGEYAKNAMRYQGLDRNAPEEIFKLALEAGVDLDSARIIYAEAMKIPTSSRPANP
jgi:hypothetical protein